MFVPIGALNFLLSFFVKDVGLPDDKPKEVAATAAAAVDNGGPNTSSPSESDIPKAIPVGENLETEKLKTVENSPELDSEKCTP
jgi:hypothetical protein